MSDFRWTAAERAGRGRLLEDRHLLVRLEHADLAVVADGAGGAAGGAEAAALAVSRAEEWCRRRPPQDFATLFELVKAVDRAVVVDGAAGLTSLALALVRPDRVLALSTGDAEVWVLGPEASTVLSGKRRYGPDVEIGTGMAMADLADLPRPGIHAILVWSDGAWGSRDMDEVRAALGEPGVEASRLLPEDGHDDDATVLLGRLA